MIIRLTPDWSKCIARECRKISKRLDIIRHTTASHLLEAGVDINTIRAWLGHVSVDTTNVYAEVNARMKAAALQTCKVEIIDNATKCWKKKGIMDFLASI